MEQHLLKIHRNLTNDDYKKIWEEAIFIFDSNVLLDLYRLPESAKNDLLTVFQNKDFNSRIWIGFQVLIEFLNNRLTIIGEQKNMFSKVASLTKNHLEKVINLNNEFLTEINKLNLNQRHSTITPDDYLNNKRIKKSIKIFNKFLRHLDEKEKDHNDVNDNDDLKDLILNIFSNKIGTSFNNEEIDKIEEEGQKRYSLEMPPGYKDLKKEGYHYVKEQKYQRKYGDLFLWKEIINHANNHMYKYVVLVTGDVKEDWWEEKRGRKIGPRKELLNEIYTCCENLEIFHMYNTSTFLKFAKQEIDADIKDSSIEDAEKLIFYNKIISNRNEIRTTKKSLQFANENVEKLKQELQKLELELRSTNSYRTKLYEDSSVEDDIREYAHNLGYLENELEEKIAMLKRKISSLSIYKSSLEAKLDFYNDDLES